jgi:hypothetical protein
MYQYLQSGNLIVRSDSFDGKNKKLKYIEKVEIKNNYKVPTNINTWKNIVNKNDSKNLSKENFPSLKN